MLAWELVWEVYSAGRITKTSLKDTHIQRRAKDIMLRLGLAWEGIDQGRIYLPVCDLAGISMSELILRDCLANLVVVFSDGIMLSGECFNFTNYLFYLTVAAAGYILRKHPGGSVVNDHFRQFR
jgi:hypothetical protein